MNLRRKFSWTAQSYLRPFSNIQYFRLSYEPPIFMATLVKHFIYVLMVSFLPCVTPLRTTMMVGCLFMVVKLEVKASYRSASNLCFSLGGTLSRIVRIYVRLVHRVFTSRLLHRGSSLARHPHAQHAHLDLHFHCNSRALEKSLATSESCHPICERWQILLLRLSDGL